MLAIGDEPPLLVCCGRMLTWRWDEDIWASACRRCGRAFALCEPIPDGLAEVSP